MSTTLPTLPAPGSLVSPDIVEGWEQRIVAALPSCDDIAELEEQRAKAAALEAWLRGKDLAGPMLGAQRRIEARIGQLLGTPKVGNPHTTSNLPREVNSIAPNDRNRFRLLARAFDLNLAEQHWRQSRRALLAYLQENHPVPRHQPDVIEQKNGRVKKSRAQRIKEISGLAQEGMRAVQIANKLGLSEQQVRKIAKDQQIALPDAFIGKTRKLKAHRIIEETVSGVHAYVNGLSILGDIIHDHFDRVQLNEWIGLLKESVGGLRKLQTTLERISRDGHRKTAA